MNKPKHLYMIVMNIGGSLHDKVYKLTLKDDGLSNDYWDKSGNHDFPSNKVNTEKTHFKVKNSGYIRIAFINVSDAQLFLEGANEFRDFCLNWLHK